MATATFTKPHQYRCQLHRPDGFVFNQRMLVTGLRHVIGPDRWTLRIALDLANPFIADRGPLVQPRQAPRPVGGRRLGTCTMSEET